MKRVRNACPLRYNREIRRATVAHAMIGILKSPPPFFEQVVAQHFAHLQDSVLEVVTGWSQEEQKVRKSEKGIMARGISTQSAPLGPKDVADLHKLLDKLPPPAGCS